MKAIILLALFGLTAVAEGWDYFVTADDNLDIETVVSDIERLKRYVDCFLDRAPCSRRTASYKEMIPESLVTNCKRCKNVQKHMARRFLSGLKIALPEDYINFKQKYDPEDKYFDDFEKAIEGF